jgi:hypothetical protein
MNTLPQNWLIEVTKENQEELDRWRQQVATENLSNSLFVGYTLLSSHRRDGSHYYCGNARKVKGLDYYADYQEITIEQFRQITNSNPTPNPMKKSIQITHSLLIEYYKAATTHQKEYLNIHFKLDGTTTEEAIRGLYDLACWDWKPRIKKNHPDCFPEESKHFDFSGHVEKNGYVSVIPEDAAESLGLNHNFIRVRHNPKNEKTHCRSFYLDSDYNWELVQDGTEDGDVVIMALIPTKKQS